jgi:hypothetical protein
LKGLAGSFYGNMALAFVASQGIGKSKKKEVSS